MSGTVRKRVPYGGSSMLSTVAATICSRVTSPSRSAATPPAGHALGEAVEGLEHERPAPARPDHVPGPQNRRVQPGQGEMPLGLRARLLIRLHDRRGLRDADEHEMPHPRLCRRVDGLARRRQVDIEELTGLRGRRIGHANQVDVGIGVADLLGERPPIERIAGHQVAPERQLVLRPRPHQRPHVMPAPQAAPESRAAR